MTAKSTKIRLLLVDDHIVLRMGLVTAANGEPDMDVVAEADNGIDAVKAYRTHRPDVVVLDLRMPGRNGIETLRQLREEFGDVRVLVFSNYASGEEVFQAFSAGARGFVDAIVTPDETRDQLAFLLRVVANYAGPHLGPFVLPPLDAVARS